MITIYAPSSCLKRLCPSAGVPNRCHYPRVALLLLLYCLPLVSQATEQVVPLQAGWNAVFLYVSPDVAHPDQAFAGLPIEQVNVWVPSRARVDSLTDPDAIPDKVSEWNVWHPPGHPAAFLNTLHRVPARRGMLIKASEPTTWIVRGEPFFQPVQWRAPAFSLVGFDVDAAQPPTFARWFTGSRAHADLTIRKLVNGHWQAVNPQETIQRGVAYWVWTREGTEFSGPLHVDLPVRADGYLALPTGGMNVTGRLANRGSLPMTITLSAEGSLSLRYAWAEDDLEWLVTPSISLDAGVRSPLRLAGPGPDAPSSSSAVLRLRGGGNDLYIPVRTPELTSNP